MAPEKDQSKQTPLRPLSREQQEELRSAQVSRRTFIKKSGGVAALTVGTGATALGLADSAVVQDEAVQPPAPYDYAWEGVPDTPPEPPEQAFVAFTEEQAAIVDALVARLLPGTPDDPGAREAGVVYYIDYLLSRNSGLHEATYTSGPYAQVYEGDTPPAEDDEETIWVKADQISRYGYQAPLSPLQVYEISLPLVQQHAQQKFGSGVTDLSEEDQDQIIWDLLEENIEGFEDFPSFSFFQALRRHTGQGMFSDPGYGGNRNLVGWSLVGFPGAQRAYSPEELVTEAEPRPPQTMTELPHFNPGETSHDDHRNVIQPVRDDESDDDQN